MTSRNEVTQQKELKSQWTVILHGSCKDDFRNKDVPVGRLRSQGESLGFFVLLRLIFFHLPTSLVND